jgi:hypothetical protein
MEMGKKNTQLVGGIPTPLKNMKVSWDHIIPNIWKNKKMFQTTNQSKYPSNGNPWQSRQMAMENHSKLKWNSLSNGNLRKWQWKIIPINK